MHFKTREAAKQQALPLSDEKTREPKTMKLICPMSEEKTREPETMKPTCSKV